MTDVVIALAGIYFAVKLWPTLKAALIFLLRYAGWIILTSGLSAFGLWVWAGNPTPPPAIDLANYVYRCANNDDSDIRYEKGKCSPGYRVVANDYSPEAAKLAALCNTGTPTITWDGKPMNLCYDPNSKVNKGWEAMPEQEKALAIQRLAERGRRAELLDSELHGEEATAAEKATKKYPIVY